MKREVIKFPLYAYRVRWSDNGGDRMQYAFTPALPEPVPNLTATGERIGFTGFATGYGIAGYVCCVLCTGETIAVEGEYLVLRSPRANEGTEGWQYLANDCVGRDFPRDHKNGENNLWYWEKA